MVIIILIFFHVMFFIIICICNPSSKFLVVVMAVYTGLATAIKICRAYFYFDVLSLLSSITVFDFPFLKGGLFMQSTCMTIHALLLNCEQPINNKQHSEWRIH